MPVFKDYQDFKSHRLSQRTQATWLLLGVPLLACGSPQEAVKVEVPVVIDATEIKVVTTDLDYEVELSEAKMMVKDFTFAIAGEAHTSLLRRSYQWLVPDALAHPGHYQGGDITGELPGRFVLNWLPGDDAGLGQASLLVGKYNSANFFLERATPSDLDSEDDPLLGHTTLLRGTAKRDSEEVSFVAVLDSPEDRLLEGIPAEFELEETSQVQLHVQLETRDTLEGDTLFDGLDFFALDEDSDGAVELGPDGKSEALVNAYNLLRRTLQTHDHFEITAVPVEQPAPSE